MVAEITITNNLVANDVSQKPEKILEILKEKLI